jgi:hypothetical protein
VTLFAPARLLLSKPPHLQAGVFYVGSSITLAMAGDAVLLAQVRSGQSSDVVLPTPVAGFTTLRAVSVQYGIATPWYVSLRISVRIADGATASLVLPTSGGQESSVLVARRADGSLALATRGSGNWNTSGRPAPVGMMQWTERRTTGNSTIAYGTPGTVRIGGVDVPPLHSQLLGRRFRPGPGDTYTKAGIRLRHFGPNLHPNTVALGSGSDLSGQGFVELFAA